MSKTPVLVFYCTICNPRCHYRKRYCPPSIRDVEELPTVRSYLGTLNFNRQLLYPVNGFLPRSRHPTLPLSSKVIHNSKSNQP